MKNLLLILFVAILTQVGFGQRCELMKFHRKLYDNEELLEFISNNAPSFEVGGNQSPLIEYDTTRVNKSTIYKFDKLELFKGSSMSGRMEMFSSVSKDGTRVYEVSQKLYISFSDGKEARKFVNSAIDTLRDPSVEEKSSTDKGIKTIKLFISPEKTGKLCMVTFRLIPAENKSYDVYIGLN